MKTKLTKRVERGRIWLGIKKYVGQGEPKMRIEKGVKEQDEKLSAGDFACVY